jgi:hypothetical protein
MGGARTKDINVDCLLIGTGSKSMKAATASFVNDVQLKQLSLEKLCSFTKRVML